MRILVADSQEALSARIGPRETQLIKIFFDYSQKIYFQKYNLSERRKTVIQARRKDNCLLELNKLTIVNLYQNNEGLLRRQTLNVG